jgi:hypothetical protein
VRLFVYAFGLKNLPGIRVCDLFKLLNATVGLVSGAELKEYKERLVAKYEGLIRSDERRAAIEIMGSEASQLLEMSREQAEQVIRKRVEIVVRENVIGYVTEKLRRRLEDSARSKDVTLTMSQLISGRETLKDALLASKILLGGGTPMKLCLEVIHDRFEREKATCASNAQLKLFVISDGDSGDGDPRPVAVRLKEIGVQIVSCYVSAVDFGQGKELYAKADRRWAEAVQVMFDIATSVAQESPELQYLREAGWVTNGPQLGWLKKMFGLRKRREAKLFAQVNHSIVLQEFLQVILATIQRGNLSKPVSLR